MSIFTDQDQIGPDGQANNLSDNPILTIPLQPPVITGIQLWGTSIAGVQLGPQAFGVGEPPTTEGTPFTERGLIGLNRPIG